MNIYVRNRQRDWKLPAKTSSLSENGSIERMLHKTIGGICLTTYVHKNHHNSFTNSTYDFRHHTLDLLHKSPPRHRRSLAGVGDSKMPFSITWGVRETKSAIFLQFHRNPSHSLLMAPINDFYARWHCSCEFNWWTGQSWKVNKVITTTVVAVSCPNEQIWRQSTWYQQHDIALFIQWIVLLSSDKLDCKVCKLVVHQKCEYRNSKNVLQALINYRFPKLSILRWRCW